MIAPSLSPRSVVPGILRVLQHAWSRFVVVDLLAKAAGLVVVIPAAAVLLRFFTERRGTSVLTDEAILWFFLSPLGLTAFVVVGAVVLWILFVEHGAVLAIARGASRGKRVTVRRAYGLVAERWAAVFQLAAGLIVRLLLAASPFVALGAAVYLTLLTEFDINYYLSRRPPAFWLAAALISALAAALVAVVLTLLVRWLLALPIVLFERSIVPVAFRESARRTAGHRHRIAGWLLAWVLVSLGISSLVTGAVGGVGRLVVPTQSGSLTLVAIAIGVAATVAVFLNLVVSVVVVSLFGVFVERVHTMCAASGRPPDPIELSADEAVNGSVGGVSVRKLAWGLILALVAVSAIALWVGSTVRVEDRTAITAHRGSSAAAPENTLAAVERAIVEGADWVEIDVQELADGTVAVVHDRDLMRLGGVRVVVARATYDDLRDIDVGSWLDPRFANERIPTLEQVLDLARGRAKVNIELKYYGGLGTLAERVIAIVEEQGMAEDVVLMSLKQDAVRQAKTLRPDWTVGLLTAVALGNAARLEADFLAVNASLATRSFIRAAHRRDRAVHVWTVNDPVQMSVLMSRGVDNIITDVPAVARAVLAERATMTAAERLLVEIGAWLGVVEVAEVAEAEPGS